MKLVFLYGPPAVGKLTVAKELARLTGYRLFHLHLTTDLVTSIFEWGTRAYDRYVRKYRLELMAAAIRRRLPGLIFTFVYCPKCGDNSFVHKVVHLLERHGGKVLFVRLKCTRAELYKRVRHESRKQSGKIKAVAKLRQVLREHDVDSIVRIRPSLTIDNTRLTPRQAALKIKRHYKL